MQTTWDPRLIKAITRNPNNSAGQQNRCRKSRYYLMWAFYSPNASQYKSCNCSPTEELLVEQYQGFLRTWFSRLWQQQSPPQQLLTKAGNCTECQQNIHGSPFLSGSTNAWKPWANTCDSELGKISSRYRRSSPKAVSHWVSNSTGFFRGLHPIGILSSVKYSYKLLYCLQIKGG